MNGEKPELSTANDNVNMTVENGNMRMNDVTSGKDANITNTGKGTINAANITSGGKATVSTVAGDIQVNKAVQATQDIAMTAKTGTIKVNDAITSTDGNVNLTVDKGNIQAGNAVRAAQDIAMATAAAMHGGRTPCPMPMPCADSNSCTTALSPSTSNS